jgi:anaerobic magnesium-protoporphyrin IX monomethyl ester cyclase
MKQVVLINNSYLENLPVRHIGAYLRHAGFKVTTIHCEGKKDAVFNLLPQESLDALAEYCSDCDLVGISLLTTHQLNRAIQINDHLKKATKAKVLWGGVPVICDPAFYLQYADYICIGEGQ